MGDIQAFIQYVRNFTQPITQIAQVSNMLQSMAAAAERVFEFLDEEEEDQTAENPGPRGPCSRARWSFDHVQLRLRCRTRSSSTISTAEVKPGQKVAIVGPTGAGKTTMVKLLMRFYDVNAAAHPGGRARCAGVQPQRAAPGLFGMVLQDTWLFKRHHHGKHPLRPAGRHRRGGHRRGQGGPCPSLHRTPCPAAIDMELNEDATNISQGQKQLLTIARAILADPPILILDEATSSRGYPHRSALIQQAMDNLMKGRTSFVIAHRLSTIKDADLILVMKRWRHR